MVSDWGVVPGSFSVALRNYGMLCSSLDAVMHWVYVKVVFTAVVCLSVQEVSAKT